MEHRPHKEESRVAQIIHSPFGYSTAVYLGKGDGTFATPVDVSACAGTTAYVSIQVGDFNRDGKTDILCGTSLLLSNGDGSFSSAGVVGAVKMESVVPLAATDYPPRDPSRAASRFEAALICWRGSAALLHARRRMTSCTIGSIHKGRRITLRIKVLQNSQSSDQ